MQRYFDGKLGKVFQFLFFNYFWLFSGIYLFFIFVTGFLFSIAINGISDCTGNIFSDLIYGIIQTSL